MHTSVLCRLSHAYVCLCCYPSNLSVQLEWPLIVYAWRLPNIIAALFALYMYLWDLHALHEGLFGYWYHCLVQPLHVQPFCQLLDRTVAFLLSMHMIVFCPCLVLLVTWYCWSSCGMCPLLCGLLWAYAWDFLPDLTSLLMYNLCGCSQWTVCLLLHPTVHGQASDHHCCCLY